MRIRLNPSLVAIGFVCLAACQGNRKEQQETSEPLADQELKSCFLRLEGQQQQDSSYLQLVIRDETVSGVYNVIPFEKDARRGTVMGKAAGDTLDLVWTFTQEGTQDTMRVVFLQDAGKLLRKPLTVDSITGRQMTRDTSAFSEAYESVDCVTTP